MPKNVILYLRIQRNELMFRLELLRKTQGIINNLNQSRLHGNNLNKQLFKFYLSQYSKCYLKLDTGHKINNNKVYTRGFSEKISITNI